MHRSVDWRVKAGCCRPFIGVRRVGRGSAATDPPPVLFIGAEPNTDWLSGSGVTLDAKGFVVSGGDTSGDRGSLETSRRGVFAIGGSVKRVAASVGEGAQVVAALHPS